jgi:hypothetical protein
MDAAQTQVEYARPRWRPNRLHPLLKTRAQVVTPRHFFATGPNLLLRYGCTTNAAPPAPGIQRRGGHAGPRPHHTGDTAVHPPALYGRFNRDAVHAVNDFCTLARRRFQLPQLLQNKGDMASFINA